MFDRAAGSATEMSSDDVTFAAPCPRATRAHCGLGHVVPMLIGPGHGDVLRVAVRGPKVVR